MDSIDERDGSEDNAHVPPSTSAMSVIVSDGKAHEVEVEDDDEGDSRKRNRRLAMNRITARERRRRKRQNLEDLECEVDNLTIMNESLQRMNGEIRMQVQQIASAISTLDHPSSSSYRPTCMLQQMIEAPSGQAINSLMNQPSINQSTLATLPTLSTLQQIQQANQNANVVRSMLQGSRGQQLMNNQSALAEALQNNPNIILPGSGHANAGLSTTEMLQELIRERERHAQTSSGDDQS